MIKAQLSRVRFAGALFMGLAIGGLPMAAPQASEIQAGDLRIQDSHVSMLPRAAKNAAVFMTIVNDGAVPDRLIGVTTTRSRRSGLMDMNMHDGLMRMVPADHFDIPSKESLKFTATGKHVMLMDLDEPLQVDETFTMVLTFSNAGEIEVGVTVIPGAMSNRPNGHK